MTPSMTGSTRSRRTPATILIGAGLIAALTGCSGSTTSGDSAGTTTGPGIDVVAQVQSQLANTGVLADQGSLTCPGVLAPEVNKTVTCSFTSDGQPTQFIAKVTSVDGTRATVEISTHASPIPKALLADNIGDRISNQLGRTPNTTCDADLPPTVGASTTCTLTDGDTELAVRVNVTSVDGGLITYSIDKR
jgi:hypothetical protein